MNEIDLLRCYIGDAKGAVPIVEQMGVVNTMRLNRAVRELAETTTGGVVLLRQGHGRLLRSAERLQADLRLQFARRLPGVIGEVVEKEIEEGLITLVEVHSLHPTPPPGATATDETGQQEGSEAPRARGPSRTGDGGRHQRRGSAPEPGP